MYKIKVKFYNKETKKQKSFSWRTTNGDMYQARQDAYFEMSKWLGLDANVYGWCLQSVRKEILE